MTHQVYISSYKKDAEWLKHCLSSLHKFQRGFLPPVVGVAQEDYALIRGVADEAFPAALVVARGNPGWMGAQIRMMESDLMCGGDVIYFLGSDCVAFQEFRPEPYCDEAGRPIILFTPYELLKGSGAADWQAGTQRVLGVPVENEYMRRLPSVFPRSIFAAMRRRVEDYHHETFAEYITRADRNVNNTSEANILGAFAHTWHRRTCHFVSTTEYTPEKYPTSILQMWSHGGLDRPTDAVVTLPDGSSSVGRTPRDLINTLVYS